MNRAILMGRLVRDPEIRYAQGNDKAIARFTLAIDREYQTQGQPREADFINCVAFDRAAEFIEKYFRQGNMLAVVGRIQTGSYTNRDGVKVYTTDVIVDKPFFTGEKREDTQTTPTRPQPSPLAADGFVNIPDGVEDEGLPFN